MPTDHMFWHDKNGNVMKYTDKEGTPVPLVAYRCKSELMHAVNGVNKPSAHRCKNVVDHDGDHRCICDKRWPNSKATRP